MTAAPPPKATSTKRANFAGCVKAPVVFVLQNGYAISTPHAQNRPRRPRSPLAPGYGFPGERVDGNDFLAVYDVAQRAVQRARSGGGPTLIESQTYRLYPHNTATTRVDPPLLYFVQLRIAKARLANRYRVCLRNKTPSTLSRSTPMANIARPICPRHLLEPLLLPVVPEFALGSRHFWAWPTGFRQRPQTGAPTRGAVYAGSSPAWPSPMRAMGCAP